MKSKQIRDLQRWLHLAFAAALGIYIYSPWNENHVFALTMKAGIFPALSLTGLVLWKWSQIKRRISSNQDSIQQIEDKAFIEQTKK